MTETSQSLPAAAPSLNAGRDWSRSIGNGAILLGLAVALVLSWGPADMASWTHLFTDAGNMAKYASGFLHPKFDDWRFYVEEMIVTLQIALWGTFLSLIVSIPLGILAAHNMAPAWIVHPCRWLLNVFRAIHEVVWAVLFVVAVGLGPFAGVMALFVHNTGIMAKLFSEAVEAIDARPVEGIRATGATRVQEVIFGVIPQVMPLWVSYFLYRFETNVRSATILGVIGAGGIGQVLFESIRGFYYPESAAILIVVVVTVSLTDILSQQLRKFFL
ncbi:phosphonate ABC transporter, permease protein PhnE [Mangrovibrevibacter kandeliae]|uniref:phosphonate ABC transporter, permease protein PhnE n=1 Tax=Mangrovibrevibacter kandeliae TaxID=2968473 RepID=UPI0021199537|nr:MULTISPECIES: phosphonate ABC transporter, permease protein PhnE [unclassified Aurantimonas]MCQ8781237.1 phosphonate ABC transporter, permease protein PhnE [Aurantimonas sp. CSK15Z-1]MCW4114016.1 phosphonate ABC transporter, permease protein PhnE [Aurantimonas sp. MSK8Z-1]